MIQFDPDTQSYYELPDGDINPMTGQPAASSQPGFGAMAPPPGTGGLSYTPGQPAFTPSGGSSIAPPIDTATGTYPAGWERHGDGLWYFNQPEAGGASSPDDGGFGPLTPPGHQSGWMPMFNAPKFKAPAPFSFQDFKAPTLDDARQEPGFEFAMEQGRKALENSAAGKGTLRTGGTLKDIFAFGNKMGEQNYGNVFGRAKDSYSLNRGNAAENYATNYGVSRDVFDRDYRGALDEFAPKAKEAELNQAQSFQEWLAKLNVTQNIFGAGQD